MKAEQLSHAPSIHAPESKVARRAQLCASHWVQGSPLPPAAEAIIPYCVITIAAVRVSGIVTDDTRFVSGGKL